MLPWIGHDEDSTPSARGNPGMLQQNIPHTGHSSAGDGSTGSTAGQVLTQKDQGQKNREKLHPPPISFNYFSG